MATSADRALVVTLNPDPPYGLLAHDPACPYMEGVPSMALETPRLDVNVARHDCLLDEQGRLRA